METTKSAGRIRSMLDTKLTVGQVLAGTFVTLSSVVTIVVYVHSTFETKADAINEFGRQERRLDKMESTFVDQTRIQTQIAVDVSYIKGKLEPQGHK